MDNLHLPKFPRRVHQILKQQQVLLLFHVNVWLTGMKRYKACNIISKTSTHSKAGRPLSRQPFSKYYMKVQNEKGGQTKKIASSGNRTRDICLEGRYFTTKLMMLSRHLRFILIYSKFESKMKLRACELKTKLDKNQRWVLHVCIINY